MHDQPIPRGDPLMKGSLPSSGAGEAHAAHAARGVWPAGLEGVAATLDALLAATAGLSAQLRHLSLVQLDLDAHDPLAGTSPLALEMAAGQLRSRSGPVYETVRTGMPVIVTADDRPCRFPAATSSAATSSAATSPAAGQEPVSELAVTVLSRGRPAGAISVYWTGTADVDVPVLTMVEALAAQAGDLIGLRRQVLNLHAAMRSRELIGQACGVLMSRYRLTEGEAMHALRLVSQERNVKLRGVSAEVVESGTLVELD